uniref:Uncharacterized protein n=1 Tax=Anguilla anguilla TaxID=7936 RepID=A0A0E9Q3E6_ANGAN
MKTNNIRSCNTPMFQSVKEAKIQFSLLLRSPS